MRILYVTLQCPFGYGESFVASEINELLRQDHSVHICPIKPSSKLTSAHNSMSLLRNNASPEPLLKPDIISAAISHLRRSSTTRRLILGMLKADTTPRVLLRNIAVIPKALMIADVAQRFRTEHIHAHWIHMNATAAMIASKITGIPFSITAHRGDIADNNLLAMKADHAEFIRFIANYGLELFYELLSSDSHSYARKAKLVRLNMGVSIPSLDMPYSPSSSIRVACPANFIPLKRQKDLIIASSLLQKQGTDVSLLLGGDGPTRKSCIELAKQLHVIAEIPGVVPNEKLLDLYKQKLVSAVVLCSSVEGTPVSLMEAMAYQIPVISTGVGDVPNLLRDGCGLIVPVGQPQSIADALLKIKNQPTEITAMTQQARARIESEYNITAITTQLASLFAGK